MSRRGCRRGGLAQTLPPFHVPNLFTRIIADSALSCPGSLALSEGVGTAGVCNATAVRPRFELRGLCHLDRGRGRHGQRGGEAAEHGPGGRLEAANCRAFYWMRNKSWHLSSFLDVWEATRWGYQESGALAEERCFLMDSKR